MSRTKACELCGTPISEKDRWYRTKRFCTRACSNRWTAQRRATTKGYVTDAKGYRLLRMQDHPRASKGGYIMEHRYVMEQMLGRPLEANEVVHHKNGDKADNRPENLEVMPKRIHDRRPKPPLRPITCPHCGGKIITSGRVRRATAG